ncbi:MAG: AraC family transcriptional regulator [Epsilonproteobacteria bacterium]|nr:AraC family transcriptional regulator [Campylobacterota bacterium]
MTITIPNHQIESNEPTLIEIDTKLYIECMNRHHKRVLIRNTMHGLTLIEEGDKEVELKGSLFKIGKNQAIFFAQGNYFSNKNSKDYKALTIFFDDAFIVDFVKKYQLKLSGNSKRITVINYKNQESICLLISSISLTHVEHTFKQKELLKLKIELLFLEFYQAYPEKMEHFFRHIIKTSTDRMQYILEENIDIIEKVSDMYQLMRMSPSHFQKQFQKNFHESPKIWLDKQRMRKAKFLLLSTNKSITEIATECDYSTSSWFIVQFKKYCKTTPKEYRVKNQYR